MMNEGYIFILADVGISATEKTQTFPTVASQQYYQFPVYYHRLKSVRITTGGRTYPVDITENQDYWDGLNVDESTSDIPVHCFMRKGFGIGGTEIGFYPKPTNDDDTFEAAVQVKSAPQSLHLIVLST